MRVENVTVRTKWYNVSSSVSTKSFQGVISGFSIGILEGSCKTIPGFKKMFFPITEDGYQWFGAYSFKCESGKGIVAVFIPLARKVRNENGDTKIKMDRDVAIYTQGGTTRREIKKILQQFSEAIQRIDQERRDKWNNPKVVETIEAGYNHNVDGRTFVTTRDIEVRNDLKRF